MRFGECGPVLVRGNTSFAAEATQKVGDEARAGLLQTQIGECFVFKHRCESYAPRKSLGAGRLAPLLVSGDVSPICDANGRVGRQLEKAPCVKLSLFPLQERR